MRISVWRIPVWMVGVAALAAAIGGLSGGRPASAATIAYSQGWHLVAGPDGTIFRGVVGDLLTLDPGQGDYVKVPSDQPVHAGKAYFAYFSGLINVRMGPDQHDAVSIPLVAGAYTFVGNPSAYSAATISGADLAYVYDQQGGYLVQTSIPPGSGALVYSYNGGTAVVRPIPGGIDATLAGQEDKLVDVAISPPDVPPSFALTRADSNGGQNGNIPVNYIEEFRPRTNPKPADPQQTTFIQINIQQTKDVDYATLLLNNRTVDVVRDSLGANAKTAFSLDAPATIGDAAKLFHVQIVNGNTQVGAYVLHFRRNQLFVTVVLLAPDGKEDKSLLLSLGATQDARISAAFP